MSRHRAVRNLDLDGRFVYLRSLLLPDYLDDLEDDVYDETIEGQFALRSTSKMVSLSGRRRAVTRR
jgi:hypothetical protein